MAEGGEYYLIQIPNLDNEPYSIIPIVLNNKTYYFEYKWNIREEKAYLSIYLLIDNSKLYLIKNRGLVLFYDLTKHIQDRDNWSGELYLKPINISNYYNYNQNNISTDYELSYVPQ